MSTVYKSPSDSLRKQFLESLKADLALLDHTIDINETSTHLEFEFEPNNLSTLQPKERMKYYKRIRIRNLEEESERIRRLENENILDLFTDGQDLQIDKIQPQIQICQTREDKEIYHYCRLLQVIPTSSRVVAPLYALVYDMGQSTRRLMGAIGLSSPIYSLAARDNILQWDAIDSKSETKRVRDLGLRRIGQLAVCIAIEPYSYLHGGKLIAMLALSDPIQESYYQRRNQPLLALVTTVISGSQGDTMFYGIHTNRIGNGYHSYAHRLFEKIGKTSEYSTIMISQTTFSLARELVGHFVSKGQGVKSQILTRAFDLCGLDREVLYTHSKGIWLANLSDRNLDALQKGIIDGEWDIHLNVADVTAYWKEHLLSQDKMATVRAFDREQNRLSRLLSAPALTA